MNQLGDQSDIFQQSGNHQEFAELCNALYERELLVLAEDDEIVLPRLRSKLKSLSYYIRRAAEGMMAADPPLEMDIHNASWSTKQANQCPALKPTAQDVASWLNINAHPGVPVVVHVQEFGRQYLVLDCINLVQKSQQKLMLNRFGWFSFQGESLEGEEQIEIRLVKPSKTTIGAACCGHVWGHKGKLSPRTLPLREILLTAIINWRNFAKPKTIRAC